MNQPNLVINTHLAGIHALRGFAAMMVLLFHLHYAGKIPLPKDWGFIASHGGNGVMLFFVLSAFSLFYSNQKHLSSTGAEWILSYFIKRFFRIAPLFYAMLGVHCMLIVYKFHGTLDFKNVLMSILFIFNFSPKDATGIVWASWSIGVEMIFYAVLPLIMGVVRGIKSAIIFWMITVVASYIFRGVLEADNSIPSGYSHFAFMSELGVFSGGVLGYWFFARNNTLNSTSSALLKNYIYGVLLLLGPILGVFLLADFSQLLVVSARVQIQLWGLVFGCIAALMTIKPKRWMTNAILQYFGERSYSIYLIHPVIIYLTSSLLMRIYQFFYPLLGGYAFAISAILLIIPTLLISEVTYRFIESPGISFGKKVLSKVSV